MSSISSGSSVSIVNANNNPLGAYKAIDTESDSLDTAVDKLVDNCVNRQASNVYVADVDALIAILQRDGGAISKGDMLAVQGELQARVRDGTIDANVAKTWFSEIIGYIGSYAGGATRTTSDGKTTVALETGDDVAALIADCDLYADVANTNYVQKWVDWTKDRKATNDVWGQVRDLAKDGDLSSADLDTIFSIAFDEGSASGTLTLSEVREMYDSLATLKERGFITQGQLDSLTRQIDTELIARADGSDAMHTIQTTAQQFIDELVRPRVQGSASELSSVANASGLLQRFLGDDGKIGSGELIALDVALEDNDGEISLNEAQNLATALHSALLGGSITSADYDRVVKYLDHRYNFFADLGDKGHGPGHELESVFGSNDRPDLDSKTAMMVSQATSSGTSAEDLVRDYAKLAGADGTLTAHDLDRLIAAVKGTSLYGAVLGVLRADGNAARTGERTVDGQTTYNADAYFANGVSALLTASARAYAQTLDDTSVEGDSGRVVILADEKDFVRSSESSAEPRTRGLPSTSRGTGSVRARGA